MPCARLLSDEFGDIVYEQAYSIILSKTRQSTRYNDLHTITGSTLVHKKKESSKSRD